MSTASRCRASSNNLAETYTFDFLVPKISILILKTAGTEYDGSMGSRNYETAKAVWKWE